MKDIDFDELDKAVSAVLETPKKSETPAPIQAPVAPLKVETPAVSEAAKAEKQEPAKAEKTEEKTKSEHSVKVNITRKSTATIKTGRSGAFMDMVHPSSRMVTNQEKQAVPTSHTGVKLEAPSVIKPAEEPEAEATAESTATAVEEKPELKPSEEKEVKPDTATGETDALSFHGFKYQADDKQAESQSGTETTRDASKDESNNTDEPAATPNEPYSSTAFVEGAKVEKRPLGAFSGPSSQPEPASATEGQTQQEATSEVKNSEVNVHSHPREYDEDILSVESDHTSEVPGQKTDKPSDAEKVTLPASPVVASIPQQYQVKDQPVKDAGPGPLFDTKDYHPPIAAHHDGEHKHFSVWVIIAVLLLLATAAAYGYWVYIGLN